MNPTIVTDEELLRLCESGQKLLAVKLYKDATGADLYEAKQYIDKLDGSEDAPLITPEDLDAQLIQLCNRNRKLDAIKLHREAMNCSLKESLEYVEALNKTTFYDDPGHEYLPANDSMMIDPQPKMGFFKRILSFFTGDKA